MAVKVFIGFNIPVAVGLEICVATTGVDVVDFRVTVAAGRNICVAVKESSV